MLKNLTFRISEFSQRLIIIILDSDFLKVMDKTDRAKVASGNTKEAQRLIAKYNKLQSRQDSLSQEKEARATKERLLEYDRTSAQRTKVIDDQSDYFATESPWLSEEEKKVMKEKKAAYEEAKNRLKRKTKVTIDFAGEIFSLLFNSV